MTALAIILAVLVLLALLPLGVQFRYDEDGAALWMLIGPVRITILPRPQKPKKAKKKRQKQDVQKKKAPAEKKEKKGGSISQFFPLLDLLRDFMGDVRRHLLIRRLTLVVQFPGSKDPAAAAIRYGQAWAVISAVMPQLERFFRIRRRDVRPVCDFTATQMRMLAEIRLTIRTGTLVRLGVQYGFRTIAFFMKQKRKKQKAEQEHAPA